MTEVSPTPSQEPGSGEFDRGVIIRELRAGDLEDLRGVLESCIVHPLTKEKIEEDIEETYKSLQESLESDSSKSYWVAENPDGKVIGVMGLDAPGDVMRGFATTDNPVELINAYVLSDKRKSGTGRQLVHHLESFAKSQGYTEIVLNSGPRFMKSGWPFWRRMYGEPAGKAEEFYDGQYDAMVWRKVLDQ